MNAADLLTDTIEQIARRAAMQEIERLESQIRFLEARIAAAASPKALLTIPEVCEMLGVCARTLKRWRDERNPRITFIVREDGAVRYRPEAIENYLKGRERGSVKAALRAA